MALDRCPAIASGTERDATRPLTASLRWGLGWTIVVASLGASAGCGSPAAVDAPATTDNSYSACVTAVGGMPDAVDQHIDACTATVAASASTL
jgi:hypothetical protein